MGSPALLLVDDDPFLRRATARALKREGYLVLEAEDGEQALTVAAAHGAVEVLVTDLTMPKLDGCKLAQRLLADRPRLKVVFLSGYAPPELECEIAAAGHRYLHKPFSAGELVKVLRELGGPVVEDA